MIDFESLGLVGLALSAFTSATLLPGTSEAVLTALIALGDWNLALLILIASVANVLGSVVNWALGRGANHFQDSRFWPVTEQQQKRADGWYKRYGWWSLFASWVPIVGDPLTLVAGAMKEPIARFLIIVGLAKTARYTLVAVAVQAIAPTIS